MGKPEGQPEVVKKEEEKKTEQTPPEQKTTPPEEKKIQTRILVTFPECTEKDKVLYMMNTEPRIDFNGTNMFEVPTLLRIAAEKFEKMVVKG